MALRKVRIVNDSPIGSPHATNVYDAETGEQLLNVMRIEMRFERRQCLVRLDLLCEVEYEGVGDVRRLRMKADGTTEEIVEPGTATDASPSMIRAADLHVQQDGIPDYSVIDVTTGG